MRWQIYTKGKRCKISEYIVYIRPITQCGGVKRRTDPYAFALNHVLDNKNNVREMAQLSVYTRIKWFVHIKDEMWQPISAWYAEVVFLSVS